jgi:hypothetical protein
MRRSVPFLTVVLLGLLLLGLPGCDSASAGSDGGGGATADFAIGDTEAQPAELFIIKALDDQQSGARIFQVYLTGGGLTVDQFGPSGTGDVINLKLLVNGDTLAEGTYQYNQSSPAAGDLTGLNVYVDYDFSSNEGETHFISGGSVVVGRPNTEYSFDFDLQTSSGNISGSFSGPAVDVIDLQQQ